MLSRDDDALTPFDKAPSPDVATALRRARLDVQEVGHALSGASYLESIGESDAAAAVVEQGLARLASLNRRGDEIVTLLAARPKPTYARALFAKLSRAFTPTPRPIVIDMRQGDSAGADFTARRVDAQLQAASE